jgi:ribosomal subunit interface protein
MAGPAQLSKSWDEDTSFRRNPGQVLYICKHMRFRFHPHGVPLSESLTEYMQDRLDRLYRDFAFITEGDVYLEEIGEVKPHREIRLHIRIPGEVLHVSERGENFQTAFDAALERIRRGLVKYKERLRS